MGKVLIMHTLAQVNYTASCFKFKKLKKAYQFRNIALVSDFSKKKIRVL
jgi:hypothetical protein